MNAVCSFCRSKTNGFVNLAKGCSTRNGTQLYSRDSRFLEQQLVSLVSLLMCWPQDEIVILNFIDTDIQEV